MPRVAAPVTKTRALLGHLLGLLLAHGAAQEVGAPERVAGQALRDLHHLLLVDEHPVRLPSICSMSGCRYSAFLPVLAVDEVLDHAGSSGPGR